MANVGPWEILVIAVVALLVFGPNRLPELGRSLGRVLREFRRASQELKDEVKRAIEEEPPPGPDSPAPREERAATGDAAPATGARGGAAGWQEAARPAEERERY